MFRKQQNNESEQQNIIFKRLELHKIANSHVLHGQTPNNKAYNFNIRAKT